MAVKGETKAAALAFFARDRAQAKAERALDGHEAPTVKAGVGVWFYPHPLPPGEGGFGQSPRS